MHGEGWTPSSPTAAHARPENVVSGENKHRTDLRPLGIPPISALSIENKIMVLRMEI
jgi:hypothetical protein